MPLIWYFRLKLIRGSVHTYNFSTSDSYLELRTPQIQVWARASAWALALMLSDSEIPSDRLLGLVCIGDRSSTFNTSSIMTMFSSSLGRVVTVRDIFMYQVCQGSNNGTTLSEWRSITIFRVLKVVLIHHYTPAQRSWRGLYWIHLVRPSVRLSVCL